MSERVHIYSPVHFERWDWRSSTERGIGGSETCHVELAWRLARRGHDVRSYAPLPADTPSGSEWRGTRWYGLDEPDFQAPGIWVIFRNAECIEGMPGPAGGQRIWLCCQDESPIGITPERAEKCERIVAYCEWHKRHMERSWPCVKGKVVVSSNGLKVDLVQEVSRQPRRSFAFAASALASNRSLRQIAGELRDRGHTIYALRAADAVDIPHIVELSDLYDKPEALRRLGVDLLYTDSLDEAQRAREAGLAAMFTIGDESVQLPSEIIDAPRRNPRRMIYASSPDRGLLTLCKIFRRAREYVSDLELHVFYGTDNIERLIEHNPRFGYYRRLLQDLKRATDQPGITWHGRVGQVELYREMSISGIWCYPTHFTETSCIQCMEQQALGAIPITRPLAALAENVQHGVFIQGSPDTDPLVRARYVSAIVALATSVELQERVRKEMVPWARMKFDWERVVDQFDAWVLESNSTRHRYQCAFQLSHARGRVLNLGCGCDPAGLQERGDCVNVDVRATDPVTGVPNKVDVEADARRLPEGLGKFNTVVIGELLEHMRESDRRLVLRQAERHLCEGGRVVVTCPEDYRPESEQHRRPDFGIYAEGVSAYHKFPLSLSEILADLRETGLKATFTQPISYDHFGGWGIVAEREIQRRAS